MCAYEWTEWYCKLRCPCRAYGATAFTEVCYKHEKFQEEVVKHTSFALPILGKAIRMAVLNDDDVQFIVVVRDEAAVYKAFMRAKENRFGFCESCEFPIPKTRLDATKGLAGTHVYCANGKLLLNSGFSKSVNIVRPYFINVAKTSFQQDFIPQ